MAKYETKLKLGRKLKGAAADKASDNQASVLFRFDDSGAERHVSLTIESDDMTVDDVVAVLDLLDARGVLRKDDSKTWVNQPQASEARFGASRTWQDVDIEARLREGPRSSYRESTDWSEPSRNY